MRRLRLPWLLALPLMAAGAFAAHSPSCLTSSSVAEPAELGELHERTSQGFAGQLVVWLGPLSALLAVALVRRAFASLGRESRGVSASSFFFLPLLAYSSQELIERVLHAESFPFEAAVEPRFLLGFASQLPFAALAFLLGWLLIRASATLARLIRGPRPQLRTRALGKPRWSPTAFVSLPRVPALARGHPLRGPPLLT
jgi:hypothetical protein